jgi:type IV pilus assembly protein PilW
MKRLRPGSRMDGRAPAQLGLSIVELMVSMALGLMVVLAATTVLLSSKSGHTSVDESTRLQDSGRYALDIIGRNVRQSAYEQWDAPNAPIIIADTFQPNITGLDGKTLDDDSDGISSSITPASGVKSDVLALRFFGSSDASGADGSVLNCGGFAVAAPTSVATADVDRGWSIFYVKNNASGEPELRCKFRTANGWNSEAIIANVESFQILYGLDTAGNGIPTRFLRANAITALDDSMSLVSVTAADKALEKLRKSNWKKVVAIKVALLVRGTQPARVSQTNVTYDLFGPKYAGENAALDPGSSVLETNLDATQRDRLRKVFQTTVLIRNRVAGSNL